MEKDSLIISLMKWLFFLLLSPLLNAETLKHYYEDLAQVEMVAQYDLGEKHGEQITYYPNGQRKSLVTYDHGVLHGPKAAWDMQGELIEEALYEAGKLTGRCYRLFPDRQKVISNYKNDLLDGWHQVFYPDHDLFGQVKALEAYYKESLLEGEFSEYNEKGIKTVSIPYIQGKKEGTALLFEPEGRILRSAEFKGDQMHGMAYEYYPDGSIAWAVSLVDGKREGEERGFFESGHLKVLNFYKNDLLEGLSREWDAQGKLVFEGCYSGGMREGSFQKFDYKRDLFICSRFEKDQKK